MFRDNDPNSKKWNEDLHTYEKDKAKKQNNKDVLKRGGTTSVHKNNGQKSPLNYKTLLLFSVFLGLFGAHRFYVKRSVSGFVMLALTLITAGTFPFTFMYFSVAIIVWYMVDLITILKGRFKDSKNRTVVPEEEIPSKTLGLAGLVLSSVILIGIVGFNIYIGNEIVKEENVRTEINELNINTPIPISSYSDEVEGTIAVTSAKLLMADIPLVEVTYEVNKIKESFNSFEPEIFNGDADFDKGIRERDRAERNNYLELYSIDEEITDLIGIEFEDFSPSEEPVGSTYSVTCYYKYADIKEHFGVFETTYIDDKSVAYFVSLDPFIEDGSIDGAVLDQLPLKKQYDEKVPMGQVGNVNLLDIKINSANVYDEEKIGARAKNDYNLYYIVLEIQITNNRKSVLKSQEIEEGFEFHSAKKEVLYRQRNTDFSELSPNLWNEDLQIKPGETKNVAFVYEVEEDELATKGRQVDYMLTYDNYWLKFNERTKFIVPVKK